MPRTTRTLARLLVAGLAVATVAVAAPASAAPAVDTATAGLLTFELEVLPGPTSSRGTQLTLTGTLSIKPIPELVTPPMTFHDGATVIAESEIDPEGRATATYTPSTAGVHHLWASVEPEGIPEVITSETHAHTVLPARCPDQARPGAGAVVRHIYLVALRRCPDPDGYAYWVDRLEGGARPATVAAALAGSIEAVGVVVDDAYRRILHRPVDAAGRGFWTAKVRAGWTTSQLWASLAASDELARGVDGLEELVEEAFARIVGRPADPGGATYWFDRFMASRTPPSVTWRAMAVTAEVVDGAVAATYLRALGRPATPAEGAAARAVALARRGDWRPLVAELLGRPEASGHAQTYPDPPSGG